MTNSLSMKKYLILLLFNIIVFSSCKNNTTNNIPKTHTIEIKQMRFQPAELIVQKGDTVIWLNNDIVDHDVTEESSKAWTSSLIPPGKSWRSVVNQNADYYCSIHVVMKGKIRVE